MKKWLIPFLLIVPAFMVGAAQPVKPIDVRGAAVRAKADEKTYPRGHKQPTEAELKARHLAAFKRHDHRMRGLPAATPETFDSVAMGWCGPVLDQGSCGTCWDFSGTDQINSTYIKAGQAKNDGSFNLSQQFLLDQCGYRNWGCEGDDAINVLEYAKSSGIPLTPDYGPYTARQGTCRFKPGTKLYRINDWGFCTPSQQMGIAATQDIKNALVQYGPVSSAVAANSDWDSYRWGAMPFRQLGANQVNHDVQIVGWNDRQEVAGTNNKGAWKVKNSWSKDWGEQGYCWIGYGSHAIGTEAAWSVLATLPPPPPPPTPDPKPPTPPGPTPTPGDGFTGSWIFKDGRLIGSTSGSSVDVTAAGKLEELRASLKFERLRWRLLIADVIAAKVRGDTDAQLDLIRARFGLTPEQWAAIIKLILQLLPLFLGEEDQPAPVVPEPMTVPIPMPMPEKKPSGCLVPLPWALVA